MATVYPTCKSKPNMATTPSSSSQSSLPPSYAIPVHDHILPPGWQCKFDPKTSKYYFLNDQLTQHWDFKKYGHQSSCHSSRISSPSHTFTSYGKYFQPFSSRYKVCDSVPHKVTQQFPQVDENYINHLMKIYNNRENLVISALLAEGYTRSFSLPPDESLFYKLKSYFPAVDPEVIRHMLIKYDNVEHEVIGAIISTLGPNQVRYQSTTTTGVTPGSPKMKLRYLKLIYPEADEAVLFDLLYNCDQNAMEAINRLEAMGYKRTDTGRASGANQPESDASKTTSKALRPQSAPIWPKTTFFPPNTAEKQKMFKTLEDAFPKVNRTLINMALETSCFNLERAQVFLSAMTPQDSSKYLPTDIQTADMSPLLARYCRGTQTNALMDTIAGTPIRTAKRDTIKVTKGTSTTEDGIIVEEKKKPVAKGADPEMRKGPNFLNLIKSYFPWKGSESKNKCGADPNNRKGADPSLRTGSKATAKGPQQSNRKGALGRLIKLKRN